ncbi:MAG: OprO/OprP family phosphate-selective porin, partial [Lysobacter sp.]
ADGRARFDDVTDWRRRSLGLAVRKVDVFDLVLDYDFSTDNWIDNYVKFYGHDLGDVRIGQFKTPVGLDDGATSSTATTFLERALPEATVHQGRRIGIDWTHSLASLWTVNVGYFDGGDFDGANEGHTVAGRVTLTPIKDEHDLLHFGVAASREHRDDATMRVRTKPEAALTAVRLVDSGVLAQVDAIDRYGIEAAWRSGPWSVQGEWLGMAVRRDAVGPDFHGSGYYAQGSWMLTGETKPNKGGGFGNAVPKRKAGAVELALRHSAIDLDDGAIAGGRQRDWTLGANWYLTQELKFQANYVIVHSERAGVSLDPRIFELRAQLAF